MPLLASSSSERPALGACRSYVELAKHRKDATSQRCRQTPRTGQTLLTPAVALRLFNFQAPKYHWHIRDRIKELRRVPAAQLRPNPRNWRTHSPQQRDALQGILAEVGYAGALLARELADGSLELIDGHLRAETTPDAMVPVLVLDVNEAEANLILATHRSAGWATWPARRPKRSKHC